jgi:virginiamycin B lyase
MAKWQQVHGNLEVISVGSRTNVWGIDKSGEIFRYSGDDNDPWISIPLGGDPGLDIGAAADGTVWYLDAAGEIFRYSWDQDHWVRIKLGHLVKIAVGSRTNVWGLNKGSELFRYTGDDANPWVLFNVSGKDIGAGSDGAVYRISPAGDIYYKNDDGTWVKAPGGPLEVISVGSRTNIWGIDKNGTILRYTGGGVDPWTKVDGPGRDIGAAPDGTVWYVYGGDIYRYIGDQPG